MDPPELRTIILFPLHVSPNPTTLPLLTALQSLLNKSYNASYCTRPDIFGQGHLRLPDASQFADLIGADGFTVITCAAKSDQRRLPTKARDGYGSGANEDGELLEIVATSSVKPVDDEDVRRQAQQRLLPAGRAAQEIKGAGKKKDSDSGSFSAASEELNDKLQALYHERQNPRLTHELKGFAVSPTHQGLGLGTRLLRTVEWLLGSNGAEALEFAKGVDAPLLSGARLESSVHSETGVEVHGIDLDEVKKIVFGRTGKMDVAGSESARLDQDAAKGVEMSPSRLGHRTLALVAVREIGNDEYFQRRGYKSLRAGVLPSGTWGSYAEFTTVYMEKDI